MSTYNSPEQCRREISHYEQELTRITHELDSKKREVVNLEYKFTDTKKDVDYWKDQLRQAETQQKQHSK